MADHTRTSEQWRPSLPAFDAEADADHDLLLIHFWASWNEHDRQMDARLLAVRERLGDESIVFRSCDTDDRKNWRIVQHCGVVSLPTLVAIVCGDVHELVVGVREENALVVFIAKWRDTRNAIIKSVQPGLPTAKCSSARAAESQDAGISISFVIPAFNEALLIQRTIRAICDAARGMRSFEIVVADDASEDGTVHVAEDCGARVVRTNNRNIAATRNAGAAAARGALLIFVDADTVVPTATLRQTLDVVERGVVAGGSACWFDEPLPFWVRVVGPPLLWLYRQCRLTPGAYVFCTRAAFDAVGGFDASVYGGEEVLMARALDRYSKSVGQRFTIVPEPIISSGRKLRTHTAFELFGALFRSAWYKGKNRAVMDVWYGERRVDSEGMREQGSGAPGE